MFPLIIIIDKWNNNKKHTHTRMIGLLCNTDFSVREETKFTIQNY